MLTYLADALATVTEPINLAVLILATLVGLVMGMLPGLSATMAIALLTSLTFTLPSDTAIISLLAIYVGSISGGCQTAILLNIPGTPASAATAVDGFPLAQQGKAGHAILLAITSSMFGTLLSVVLLLTLTPLLSRAALSFGTWEFFLLAVFGVAICGTLAARDNVLKGWIAGLLGLFVAQVGLDPLGAEPRFTFGSVNLKAGIELIPIMIGLFGFPEIVKAFRSSDTVMVKVAKAKIGGALRTVFAKFPAVLRSSAIGTGVGVIPGVGEDVGGWLSFAASKNLSKDPESFGKGNELGVISAETGNNAAIGGALVPILSLAVPGSAPAAVLLAAFLMHGYRPGPLLASQSPEFVYEIAVYLAAAAVVMWCLALLVMKFSVRILSTRKEILMPIVYVLCVIGSYLIRFSLFDVGVMMVFGLIGYFLYTFGFPAAPFLLGVILGPMADSNLRRALLLSHGSWTPMFTRPISVTFLVLIAITIAVQFGVIGKVHRALTSRKREMS